MATVKARDYHEKLNRAFTDHQTIDEPKDEKLEELTQLLEDAKKLEDNDDAITIAEINLNEYISEINKNKPRVIR